MAQGNPFDKFDEPSGGMIVRDPTRASSEARADAASRRAEESLQLQREAAARSAANQDKPPAGYRWNANHTGYEVIPGGPAETGARNARLTAKERVDAITGYKTAQQLRTIIDDIKRLDKEGPGSTSGLAGLSDYLPLTSNQRLDAAGNAARGIVGQALGFTGGQLNTATEAAMAVGPYLPQAGDRDEVRADKIRRLEELANTAEQRSVSLLGGKPDESGNILPVSQATPLSNMAGAGPTPPASTGDPSIDPNGGNPLLSEQDRSFISANARYMTPESMQKWFADRKLPIPRENAQEIYDYYAKGGQQNAETNVPQSEGTALGALAATPLGSYGIGAANAMTAGNLDEIVGYTGGDAQAAQQAKDLSAERNPLSSLAGNVTGGVLGTLGAGRAFGAIPGIGARVATAGGGLAPDLLYGAAYGAGEDNENRLLGATTGAAGAGIGNFVGRGVTGMFGRGVRGVSNPDVQALRAADVPLTAGQMLSQSGVAGRAVKGLEDKFESVPYLGDAIRQRRQEGLEAWGQAVGDQGLAPIGGSVRGLSGNDAIEAAQRQVGDAYSTALGPVRLSADAGFNADMTSARAAGGSLPGGLADTFNATIANRVDPFIAGGNMTGRDLQAAIKGLRTDAGSIMKRSEPMADIFKDRTVDVEDALMGLAERQAPGTRQGLSNANQAYRNLSILEDATLAADNAGGVYTPAQLGRAQINNAKRFGGKKGAAAGNLPFRDIQAAGQAVLPSTTPNSGTTDRALATWLLPTALGGAAVSADNAGYLPSEAAVPLAIAGLATTKGGRKAAEKLLLDRPDIMRQIGDTMFNQRRLGGMFGAQLGITGSQR